MLRRWWCEPIKGIDPSWLERGRLRQAQLTKPAGSLGLLEEIGVRISAMQQQDIPCLDRVRMVVFAGDHGVAAAGVSAFPQSVTVEMIHNFARGGAAISVLARHLGATLEVVDVGAVRDPGDLPGVVRCRVGAGTKDFRFSAAMTTEQLYLAMNAGREAVARSVEGGSHIFLGGEMGIGNTTAATALVCAMLGVAPEGVTGSGTGVDGAGLARKIEVIKQALDFHRGSLGDPLAVLSAMGGFEIAALVGAYIAAGQVGIPVVVDGFIAGSAALVAIGLQPELKNWFFYAHQSVEPGHRIVFAKLDERPLLDLNMRLGEGSGAAVVLPILRLACALHGEMATFAQAGVQEKQLNIMPCGQKKN
ncbi:MAG: nicotinate-nucleotide--dimethylbenzimidazole phosphoribosyltransferase [Magnetococcus sp. DMHC-6]